MFLAVLSDHAGIEEVSTFVTSKVMLTPRNFNFPSKDKFGNDLVGHLHFMSTILDLLTVFNMNPWRPFPGGH